MKSHEVLKAACRKAGCKVVAAELKVSLALVHKWTSARADGRSQEWNPLDRVARLYALTRDMRLVRWVCAQAGGFFVANPPEMPAGEKWDATRAENGLLHDIGVFQQALAEAMAEPGSAERRAGLRVSWEGLKTSGEGLVRAVERGWLRLVWWYGLWDALTPGGVL